MQNTIHDNVLDPFSSFLFLLLFLIFFFFLALISGISFQLSLLLISSTHIHIGVRNESFPIPIKNSTICTAVWQLRKRTAYWQAQKYRENSACLFFVLLARLYTYPYTNKAKLTHAHSKTVKSGRASERESC